MNNTRLCRSRGICDKRGSSDQPGNKVGTRQVGQDEVVRQGKKTKLSTVIEGGSWELEVDLLKKKKENQDYGVC